MPTTQNDPLEAVIRPIVEGQINSFINDHPNILKAVDWYKPAVDKRPTLVGSISKRIMTDLLCPANRVRLVEAIRNVKLDHKGALSRAPDPVAFLAAGASE